MEDERNDAQKAMMPNPPVSVTRLWTAVLLCLVIAVISILHFNASPTVLLYGFFALVLYAQIALNERKVPYFG